MANQKRALVYCRVSTMSQEENGTSLESQAKECIKYAEKEGYKVEQVVKEAYSGAYLHERPLLDNERQKIRDNEYEAVIVYAVDRLSRKATHLAILSDEFERFGVDLCFVTDNLDNSPMGQVMQSLKVYVAEIEREKIAERCLRGKRTQALNGKPVLATDLYGYTTDRVNKKRIINSTEARIVKRIYSEYLNGKGIAGIARRLNNDEIPSPSSGKRKFKKLDHFTNLKKYGRTLWNKGAIKRILNDSAYCGKSYAFKYKGTTVKENGKHYNRIKMRSKDEWISLPDDVTPAIVSNEVFEAVQQKLKSNQNANNTRNKKKPVLLRGLVFCGVCGRKMYPETEKKTRLIFRCPSRSYENCGGKRINASLCENSVWNEIVNIIQNPKTIALELKRRKKSGHSETKVIEGNIESIKHTLDLVEKDIERIAVRASTVEDEFIYKTFEKQLKLKKQERDRILTELSDAENQLNVFNSSLKGWEEFSEFSKRVVNNIDTFGFDDKRLALQALNVKVVGNGKNIELKHSFPVEKTGLRTNHSDIVNEYPVFSIRLTI